MNKKGGLMIDETIYPKYGRRLDLIRKPTSGVVGNFWFSVSHKEDEDYFKEE